MNLKKKKKPSLHVFPFKMTFTLLASNILTKARIDLYNFKSVQKKNMAAGNKIAMTD